MTAAFTIEVKTLKEGAGVLRALLNPIRQKIIREIHRNKSINVTDLYTKLRLEQSIASSQLGILRSAGFLLTEREGRKVYYSLNYNRFAAIDQLLKAFKS